MFKFDIKTILLYYDFKFCQEKVIDKFRHKFLIFTIYKLNSFIHYLLRFYNIFNVKKKYLFSV